MSNLCYKQTQDLTAVMVIFHNKNFLLHSLNLRSAFFWRYVLAQQVFVLAHPLPGEVALTLAGACCFGLRFLRVRRKFMCLSESAIGRVPKAVSTPGNSGQHVKFLFCS